MRRHREWYRQSLLAAATPATIGLVEAGTLEDNPHTRENLAEFTAARGAGDEGGVGKGLDGFHAFVALLALVFVGWHNRSLSLLLTL